MKQLQGPQNKYKPSVILFKHKSFAVVVNHSPCLWKTATDLRWENSNIWKYGF